MQAEIKGLCVIIYKLISRHTVLLRVDRITVICLVYFQGCACINLGNGCTKTFFFPFFLFFFVLPASFVCLGGECQTDFFFFYIIKTCIPPCFLSCIKLWTVCVKVCNTERSFANIFWGRGDINWITSKTFWSRDFVSVCKWCTNQAWAAFLAILKYIWNQSNTKMYNLYCRLYTSWL